MNTKNGTREPMSDDHKEALALGRTEGRVVRNYLEALDNARPKRGRKRTPETIQARLDVIGVEIENADPLKRLQLTQERLNLERELSKIGDSGPALEDLEAEFCEIAKGYAQRQGLTYAAFREIGVPAPVLKKAGITRSGN